MIIKWIIKWIVTLILRTLLYGNDLFNTVDINHIISTYLLYVYMFMLFLVLIVPFLLIIGCLVQFVQRFQFVQRVQRLFQILIKDYENRPVIYRALTKRPVEKVHQSGPLLPDQAMTIVKPKTKTKTKTKMKTN